MLERKTLTRLCGIAALALAAGGLPAYAQQSQGMGKSGGTASEKDQKMMQEIAQANLAEIETAKLALSKSQNDEVRTFAQKMIDDHSKAQKDLAQVAEAQGVTLPTQIDAKHKKSAEKLSKLSGDDFDRAYMKENVSDHKAVHKKLQQAQKSKDAELKDVAAKTDPVVQEHLKMAQQSTVTKTASSTSDKRLQSAQTTATGGGKTGTSASGAPSGHVDSGK